MPQPEILLKYIDNEPDLVKLGKTLREKTEFAFDTEFDRFYREYGFKLSLLQIFDGEAVYLVDPIAVKNLQALWPVFEDPAICKVVYSCSEDIQILKVNGCYPRNIYDIQIAAKLCNYSATSLSGMLLAEFGIEADKTLQRSNWRRRPLSQEQLIYAGNDVSKLLKLKEILDGIADNRGVAAMIREDNKACEKITVTEFSVKLSVLQKRKYDPQHQQYLLDLMLLRNEIAIEYNVPPANIVSDGTLEGILENKAAFLAEPFGKGFSKRLAEDNRNKQRFLNAIKGNNVPFSTRSQPDRRNPARDPENSVTKPETEFDRKYARLYDAIISEYGKDSGEHILRGYKKYISSDFQKINNLKEYQQKIIEEMNVRLGLDFGKPF